MKIYLAALSLILTCTNMSGNQKENSSDALKLAAENELKTVLHEQKEFVKLHAAEYLIWLGQIDEAKKVFLQEEKAHHTMPKYRVVVWRVLAQTETEPKSKAIYTDQIYKAFADENGLDRIHAAETLGKLKLSPSEKYPNETNKVLTSEKENLYLYTLWASSHSSPQAYTTNKAVFFDLLYHSKKEDLRRISAFILRREQKLTDKEWLKLSEMAIAEPSNSPLKKTMLNTAFETAPNDMKQSADLAKIKTEMLNDANQLTAGGRIELALVLADCGNKSDLPLLKDMLENKDIKGFYESNTPVAADVRAAAAYAILKIYKQK